MSWCRTVMAIALLAAAVVCCLSGCNFAAFAYTLGSIFVWGDLK